MVAELDRETARRQAKDILEDLTETSSNRDAFDAVVELKELCGLHESARRRKEPSKEAILRIGGVAREFAEQAWRLGRIARIDALRKEFADVLAAAFRRTEPGEDRELRATILRDMWSVVEIDLERGRNTFPKYFAKTFRHATTDAEREDVRDWFEAKLEKFSEPDDIYDPKSIAGHWMLEYVGEDLSDEAFESVCEETRQFVRWTERKLDAGEVDTALEWAERADPQRAKKLCQNFRDRDRIDALVEADVLPDPRREPMPVSDVRDTATMLIEGGRVDAALPWVRIALREGGLDVCLYDFRDAAEEAGVYGDRFREALEEEALDRSPGAMFDFYLRYEDVGAAFDLWEGVEIWDDAELRDTGERLLHAAEVKGAGDVVFAVATTLADLCISERGRENYADACEYLSVAKNVVEAGDVPVSWESLIAEYEGRLERLPALRNEAAEAGLLD